MIKAFKRLWNDKRGNVLIIAGAALPLLIGSAGLATDTIQWTLWKRQLQRAADSAAIAGVYDRDRQADRRPPTSRPPSIATWRSTSTHGMALISGYPAVDLSGRCRR